MSKVLDKILRAGEGRALKQLEKLVDLVNAQEPRFASMSDQELRAMTDQFKKRYADGEYLDDLLPEAFAVVREASKRTLVSATTTYNLWVEPRFIGEISPK